MGVSEEMLRTYAKRLENDGLLVRVFRKGRSKCIRYITALCGFAAQGVGNPQRKALEKEVNGRMISVRQGPA